MNQTMYTLREIGTDELEAIKKLFVSVFTAEPWNDDWSDENQLHLYLNDLVGQNNSLTFGLYENDQMLGLSMGRIKHWYSGTEYCIDEFCIRTDSQGNGLGTLFLNQIEAAVKAKGMRYLFLQTETDVPAYRFYLKNGFKTLENDISLAKKL